MNVASRLLKDVSFKFVCKMRGFCSTKFSSMLRAGYSKMHVFKVFYPKFSVYIKKSNNICEFSLYIQFLFIDVMKRFNKIANIEGNRVNISAMRTTTTNLWLL